MVIYCREREREEQYICIEGGHIYTLYSICSRRDQKALNPHGLDIGITIVSGIRTQPSHSVATHNLGALKICNPLILEYGNTIVILEGEERKDVNPLSAKKFVDSDFCESCNKCSF